MKYGIYGTINYQYARHGMPERLIAVIEGSDLGDFVAELKKSGYIGHFSYNGGHFRKRSAQASSDKREFHIIPYKGIKSTITDWRSLLK